MAERLKKQEIGEDLGMKKNLMDEDWRLKIEDEHNKKKGIVYVEEYLFRKSLGRCAFGKKKKKCERKGFV